jgi:hypothetical protein
VLTWLRRGAKDDFQEDGFWSYFTSDIEQRKRCLRRLMEVLEEEGTPEALAEVAELKERAARIAKDEEELRSAALKEARDDMLAWAEAVGVTLYAPHCALAGLLNSCGACWYVPSEDGEASGPACVRGLQGGQGEGQGESQGQGQGRGQEAQGRQATGGGGGGSHTGDAAAERRQGGEGEGEGEGRGQEAEGGAAVPTHGDKPAAAAEDEAVAATGDGDEEENECSICMTPMGVDDDDDPEGAVETLLCSHAFHPQCIVAWMTRCQEKGLPVTCPYCRADLVRGGR